MLELNGSETPDEMQINTVTQQATIKNPEKPKPTFHQCKKRSHHRNPEISNVIWNERKNKPKTNQIRPATTLKTTVVKKSLYPTTRFPKLPTQTIKTTGMTTNQGLPTNHVRPVVKPIILQRIVTLEPTQLIDRPLPTGSDDRKDRLRSNKRYSEQLERMCSTCSPELKLETPRFHFPTASDGPEAAKATNFLSIPEVVCQQAPETCTNQYKLDNNNYDSTIQTTQETQRLTKTHWFDVASQTSPPMGIQPKNPVVATELNSPTKVKEWQASTFLQPLQ